ncbi:hypothetical protein ACNOYE_11685 [Nannocystaceae bacterium ST9]
MTAEADEAAEWARLAQALELSSRFELFLIRVDDRSTEASVLERVEEFAETRSIAILDVDVGTDAPVEQFLKADVAGPRIAVVRTLELAQANPAALQRLFLQINQRRDFVIERWNAPILVCLRPDTLALLPKLAPDLYSVHRAQFWFRAPLAFEPAPPWFLLVHEYAGLLGLDSSFWPASAHEPSSPVERELRSFARWPDNLDVLREFVEADASRELDLIVRLRPGGGNTRSSALEALEARRWPAELHVELALLRDELLGRPPGPIDEASTSPTVIFAARICGVAHGRTTTIEDCSVEGPRAPILEHFLRCAQTWLSIRAQRFDDARTSLARAIQLAAQWENPFAMLRGDLLESEIDIRSARFDLALELFADRDLLARSERLHGPVHPGYLWTLARAVEIHDRSGLSERAGVLAAQLAARLSVAPEVPAGLEVSRAGASWQDPGKARA